MVIIQINKEYKIFSNIDIKFMQYIQEIKLIL